MLEMVKKEKYYGLCPKNEVTLIFWVGSIAVPTLLVVWAIGRARVSAAKAPYATGQPTAKEILQTQYARGEITREQYELRKQNTE